MIDLYTAETPNGWKISITRASGALARHDRGPSRRDAWPGRTRSDRPGYR